MLPPRVPMRQLMPLLNYLLGDLLGRCFPI